MFGPLVAVCLAFAVAGSPAPEVYGPGVGGNIPDNDMIGFLSPIVIDHDFPITALAVRIHGLQHGYCSDLTIELRHPGVSAPVLL